MIFTGRLSLLSAASRGQSRHFMTSAISQRHTTLSFRIAGSGGEIFTKTYTSKKDFQLASYGANFTNPKTGFTYPASELLNQHRDPSVVYIARHPLLPARSEDYDLTQITDKAFEDEACRALEIYFQLHSQGTVRHNNPKRADGWRVITGDDGRDIVEWEGIWKSPNGHVYLLEAKHLVNFVSFSFKVLSYLHCIGQTRRNSREIGTEQHFFRGGKAKCNCLCSRQTLEIWHLRDCSIPIRLWCLDLQRSRPHCSCTIPGLSVYVSLSNTLTYL